MFKVEADKAKNLLAVSYSQRVGPEEAERSALEAEKLLHDVQPGFILLTDLTGLEEMDPACAPYIQKAMDRFTDHGVKRVIRVIPDPSKDIGLNIMAMFHYRRDVQIATCDTLDQAMELLAA
jgi:hypothetical protein